MLHEVHFISKEVGRSGVAKRHRSQIMSIRVHNSNERWKENKKMAFAILNLQFDD